MISKRRLAIATLILPFLYLAACTRPQPNARDPLEGLHAEELSALKFSEVQAPREVKGHSIYVYRARAEEGEVLLTRIENLESDAAAQLLAQKKFQVEELYREEKSPYPGFLSKNVSCPKDFQPEIEFKAGEVLRVRAGANARRSLGVCNAGELHFVSVQLFVYCPNRKMLFQIESYLPKSETAKAARYLRQVSC